MGDWFSFGELELVLFWKGGIPKRGTTQSFEKGGNSKIEEVGNSNDIVWLHYWSKEAKHRNLLSGLLVCGLGNMLVS